MTLAYTYAGAAVTHKAAPSALNITHRADGESSFGGVPFEDPAGTLAIVGHKLFTVEDDECAQTRLFTGFTTERGIGRDEDRGMFVGSAPRLVDVTIVDMNAALGFRQITGADGNRPAETWQARCTWILGSDYLSEWISADETWIVTNTVSCEAADYRSAYPTAVLDDLVDRSGGAYVYFVFWDAVASEVRLFFDNDNEVIGACTLAISNVVADIDSTTTFAPDMVAKLAREPDQTYSDVEVVYDRGGKKLYRHRPSTATTYVRRGAPISRPYTKSLATATSQAEKWLDKHSVETDRITCTIRVPADSVGLIQAGQSIAARFSHLGLPYSAAGGATMRIVSYSPKPTNDVGDYYDVALELVGARAVVNSNSCSNSLAFAVIETDNGEPPCSYPSSVNLSLGITPDDESLLLAFFVGYDGDTPGATNMSAVTGYTTIANTDHQKTTYVVAYKANAPADVESIAAASYDSGYCLGSAQDPWVTAQIAIPTTTAAIVQSLETTDGFSQVLSFASAPTVGNMLIAFTYVANPSATPFVAPPAGWTTLAQPYLLTVRGLETAIFAHCVEAGDDNEFTFAAVGINVDSTVVLTEWAITGSLGGNADTVIDLGPTPGATTTHTTDPTVDDDAAAGYTVGSTWINTATGAAFILVDSTTGAAAWVTTTASGAPTTVDYLVGTASGALSAEIVVGTTPGGELGGTWASPTVDATHSGSAHLALGATSSTAAAGDHTHATGGELLIADAPLDFPHGTFFTTASQTVGSTTTAYAVAFAGEGDVDGLTHSTVTNNSRIGVLVSGEYNIIVSAIGDLTSGTNQHIDVWLAIDGSNVDDSNTIVQVLTTAETLIAASFNLDLAAGQYFEIMYHGDSTSCQLLQTAAAATPTRPASPAVILTVNMEAPMVGFVSKGITLLLNDAGDDLLYADA